MRPFSGTKAAASSAAISEGASYFWPSTGGLISDRATLALGALARFRQTLQPVLLAGHGRRCWTSSRPIPVQKRMHGCTRWIKHGRSHESSTTCSTTACSWSFYGPCGKASTAGSWARLQRAFPRVSTRATWPISSSLDFVVRNLTVRGLDTTKRSESAAPGSLQVLLLSFFPKSSALD